LLYHYFYALPKSNNPTANDYELLTLYDDEALQSFGIVHFYGDRKPWGRRKEGLPKYVQSAQARWHEIYNKLQSNPKSTLPNVSSPLTKLGTARYLEARVLYPKSSTTPGKSSRKDKKGIKANKPLNISDSSHHVGKRLGPT